MNREFIKFFSLGFLSIFRHEIYNIRRKYEVQLIEYFTQVEGDMNIAFNKLKNEYERD